MPIQTPYFTNYDAIIAINHQWQIWQLDNLWKNRFSVNSTHGQDVVQTGQFVESAFGKNTLQLPIFGHVSSEFSENWRVCESFSPSVNQSANWFVCKSSTVGSKISQPLLLISIVKSFLSHLAIRKHCSLNLWLKLHDQDQGASVLYGVPVYSPAYACSKIILYGDKKHICEWHIYQEPYSTMQQLGLNPQSPVRQHPNHYATEPH